MSQANKIPAVKKEQIDETKKIVIQMFNSENEVKEIQDKEDTKPIDEATKKWNMNDKITGLFADKIENDTKLKGRYAIILIVILSIQLVSLDILFILKGCNVLKFADSTFNIFITGGLAEIFVLIRTIVKYLFNDNLTELLKIILRANNNNYYKENKKRNNNKKKEN